MQLYPYLLVDLGILILAILQLGILFILIIRPAFIKLLIPSSSNFFPLWVSQIYSMWCVLKLFVTQQYSLRHHLLCQELFYILHIFWCCLVGSIAFIVNSTGLRNYTLWKKKSHCRSLTSVCAMTSVGNSESPLVNFLLKFWLFYF